MARVTTRAAAEAKVPAAPNPEAHGRAEHSARRRREAIVAMLAATDRVSVASLMEHFGVSGVVIRRDLSLLEDAGQLRRIHGGAVPPARVMRVGRHMTAARRHAEEKARIGALAATLIGAGDVVIFDSGSTIAQVAANVPAPLRRPSAITVVTSSLVVIDEVGGWEDPHLVCLGGFYLPRHQALVGPQTLAGLRELSADITFMGCDGLTVETGLTTPHELVAEVGAMMAARARRVVVAADGSKLGRRGFRPIIPISAINVLVTDSSADPAELDRVRDVGVEIMMA